MPTFSTLSCRGSKSGCRGAGLSRVLSIAVVYLLFILVVAGVLALIIPPAAEQTSDFISRVPEFYERAQTTVENWNRQYSERIPEDIRARVNEGLQGISDIAIEAARTVLTRSLGAVSNAFTIVISIAVIPMFLFYVLKDRERAVEGLLKIAPATVHHHVRNVIGIVNHVLGAYIRAQLFLGLVVGTVAFIGLTVLKVPYSLVLAIIAGVTELIPVLGPLLGAIPGVLVTLAVAPDKVLWVILMYAGIQTVGNVFLVPRIQGHAVEIHPAVILIILIVASEAAGIWGVLVGVPFVAVAKNLFWYFYTEWDDTKLSLITLETAAQTAPPPDTEPGPATAG